MNAPETWELEAEERGGVPLTVAYDIKLKRPGCVLVQPVLGATITNWELMSHFDWELMSHFDTSTWLLTPTPDMHVYRTTKAQLERLAEITREAATP